MILSVASRLERVFMVSFGVSTQENILLHVLIISWPPLSQAGSKSATFWDWDQLENKKQLQVQDHTLTSRDCNDAAKYRFCT